MIQQLLIYCISISILVIILIFINRVISFKNEKIKVLPKTTSKKLKLPNLINNNVHPEKKFYWANNEKIN